MKTDWLGGKEGRTKDFRNYNEYRLALPCRDRSYIKQTTHHTKYDYKVYVNNLRKLVSEQSGTEINSENINKPD